MQAPQIIVFEPDGGRQRSCAGQVRALAEARRWLLREAKTPDAALKLLARGGPTALLLRVGRDLEREFGLLERAAWLYPTAAVVVVGDSDHAILAGLAWDLGARAVLIPAPDQALLQETVAGLLQPEEVGRAVVADPG